MKKSQFTVSDVHEDMTITVYFAKKTVLDYAIFWVILLSILMATTWFVLYKTGQIKFTKKGKEGQK